MPCKQATWGLSEGEQKWRALAERLPDFEAPGVVLKGHKATWV